MNAKVKKPQGPRLIDRVYGFFGVPSAVRHNKAIVKAQVAVIVEMEVQNSSKALTDALRQLSDSLNAGSR